MGTGAENSQDKNPLPASLLQLLVGRQLLQPILTLTDALQALFVLLEPTWLAEK